MSTEEEIRADLVRASDEEIALFYLKDMIDHHQSWEGNVIEDDTVFNKNPREEYEREGPIFVANKSRTEACGKTDGCESGCWRIIGGAKMIKSEASKNFLGLKSKWNSKQDHVLCKIRLLFRSEIATLLAKHHSRVKTNSLVAIPAEILLPEYGIYSGNQEEDDEYYIAIIAQSGEIKWPEYVTTDVFAVHPSDLLDPEDRKFIEYGICFYVNERGDTRRTGGSWRIKGATKMIKDQSGKFIGLKSTFEFVEGEESEAIFTMDEYRMKKDDGDKFLCLIKLQEMSSSS
ncbi:unnamed protein product [Microthlaspi erraticum]|uniref:NAC domain-containing protein n=1 Tax=Microthlaspi erraticum TaxID=1685480 RepID=A0A6D2K835_9BRAS|nr:unnamed protein product [Microthlaspi erraticum]